MRLANQRFCFSWGSDQRLAFTPETHLPKTGTPANTAQPQQAANLLSLSSCLLRLLQQPHQPEVQLSKYAALPNSGFALAGVRDYFRAFKARWTRTQAKANAQLKLGDERTRPLPEARRADAAAHGQWAAKVLSWGLPQATTKSGNATPGRRQA